MVLAHKAPVIHPVIHFQAIPNAINTVSEQASHFSSKARRYSLGKWQGFVMLYHFMFFKLPVFILLIYLENLSLRWASLMCQGLFDNTNTCSEYSYTVKDEILTGAAFWKNTFWFKSRLLSCRSAAQGNSIENSLLVASAVWPNALIRIVFPMDVSNTSY